MTFHCVRCQMSFDVPDRHVQLAMGLVHTLYPGLTDKEVRDRCVECLKCPRCDGKKITL
jgi:hypothetical protein